MLRQYNAGSGVMEVVLGMAVWALLIAAGAWYCQRLDIAAGFLTGSLWSIAYVLLLFRQIDYSVRLSVRDLARCLLTGWFQRLTLALSLFLIPCIWPSINLPAVFSGFFCFQTMVLSCGIVIHLYRLIFLRLTQ